MRNVVSSVLLGLLALVLLATPALAGKNWCFRDPVVRLNGTEVQILVAIPDEYVELVNGPAEFEIATPAGVTREVTFTDDGFNGHGEVVTFVDGPGSVDTNGKFSVRVTVRVPIDEDLAAKAGIRTGKIQVQIIMTDDGVTKAVRGTSDNAQMNIKVQSTN
jgi:hypothetical protein